MRLSRSTLVLGCCVLWGCAGFDVDGGGEGPGPPSGGPNAPCEEPGTPACEVFDLVNEARSAEGVDAFGWSAALADAALLHAVDMAENDYFDHTSQDGRDFGDRAEESDYAGFATGENIAGGQRTPQEAMASWMESEGHRQNILSRDSNEIGIGVRDTLWVQVFGRR